MSSSSLHPLNFDPIIIGYKKANNFGRLIEMEFEILGPGELEYKMIITDKHLATPIAAHGGVLSTLMDSVLGICALSLFCAEGKIVSTVEMKINFLAPVFVNDRLIGRSKVLSKGKRLSVTEAEIMNQKGVVVAKGMGTFNAYPKEKAGY
jgi:acyl-CoA thioesterase